MAPYAPINGQIISLVDLRKTERNSPALKGKCSFSVCSNSTVYGIFQFSIDSISQNPQSILWNREKQAGAID